MFRFLFNFLEYPARVITYCPFINDVNYRGTYIKVTHNNSRNKSITEKNIGYTCSYKGTTRAPHGKYVVRSRPETGAVDE
jgi:hypothetical protein